MQAGKLFVAIGLFTLLTIAVLELIGIIKQWQEQYLALAPSSFNILANPNYLIIAGVAASCLLIVFGAIRLSTHNN